MADVRIEPPSARVADTPVEFTLLVDGVAQDEVEWELTDSTGAKLSPAAGKLIDSSVASVTAPDTPHFARAKLRGTTQDADRHTATAEIQFDVVFYDDGPRPVVSPRLVWDLPWDTPKAQRAASLMWDALQQLPPQFVEACRRVQIVRVPSLTPKDANPKTPEFDASIVGVHIPWYRGGPAVLLPDLGLIDELDETAAGITPADVRFVGTFVHELAHAAMAFQCMGASPDLFEAISKAADPYREAFRYVLWTGLFFAFSPSLLLAMVDYLWANADEDLMAQYSRSSGWVMNHMKAVRLPVIGPLIAPFTTQPPDVVTGLIGNVVPFVGLRNEHDPQGKLQSSSTNVNPYLRDYAIARAAWVKANKARKAGDPVPKIDLSGAKKSLDSKQFVSMYASKNVHEDWADTITVMALGVDALNDAENHVEVDASGNVVSAKFRQVYSAGGAGYPKRRDFIVSKKLWPKTWKPFTPGAKLMAHDPDSMDLWSVAFPQGKRKPTKKGKAPAPRSVKSDGPTKIPPQDPAEHLGWEISDADAEEIKDSVSLIQDALRFLVGEEVAAEVKVLQQAEAVLRSLELPPRPDEPPLIELARTLELHGEGLHPYGPAYRADAGDLLFRSDGSVLVVTATKDGVVGQATGLAATLEKWPQKPGRVEAGEIVFAWKPDSSARPWRDGSLAGVPNAAEIMPRIVRLWGEQSSPQTRRDVFTAGGFFAELHDAFAWKAPVLPLGKEESDRDAIAFCHTHGGGLVPPSAPDAVDPAPGDVVLVKGSSALGLVTRAEDAVDGVVVGLPNEGPLEEPTENPRLHRLARDEIAAVWRPGIGLRSWTGPDRRGTTFFADADVALNHMISHVGSSAVRRGSKQRLVIGDNYLVPLALMLESEVTPEARAELDDVDLFDGLDHQAHSVLYLYGEPSAGGPLAPGDLIRWRRGKTTDRGVVLSVGEDGAAHRLFGIDDADSLAVIDEVVPAGAVEERWTPSAVRRELPPGAMRDFYGEPSALSVLLRRRLAGASPHEKLKLGSDAYSFDRTKAEGLPFVLAAGAPTWVKARLWTASYADRPVASLQKRVETLGAGLEDVGDGRWPAGTWLFTKTGFAVVLSNREDGTVAAVLTHGTDETEIAAPDLEKVTAVWRPSPEPFDYGVATPPSGILDVNAFLGFLRVWPETANVHWGTPLFKNDELLGCGWLHADLVKRLRRGPDAPEEWRVFLAELGEGVPDTAAPRAGDFLLLSRDRLAIALDDGTAVAQHESRLVVAEPGQVEGVWRPVTKG